MPTIVKAEAADLEQILNLQHLAYRSEAEIYSDFTIQPLTQTLDQIEEEFLQWHFYKVELDGKLVGSVRAQMKEGTVAIGKLIVDPSYQNQGFGTALMTYAEQQFEAAERFELFTGSKSIRNLSLYNKLGYLPFYEKQINEQLSLVFLQKKRATKRSNEDDAAI
ncbi:GNAT family N-acetyltransferase [Paenibacillus sp. GCM10027627]|uniref:GNAT family N-acetyltransferase n=1 Tax=unclassified Paenibacillus TaxID=185978 RepID=UPI00363E822B